MSINKILKYYSNFLLPVFLILAKTIGNLVSLPWQLDTPYYHICSTSFSIKYDLVVHSRTHASVKKFTCESCEKTYSTKRALQEHSRTHTGEKPYQCNLCKKSFALPKTLRVHFRQHSGERPYLCSHCGMTFVQNSTLRNHLKTNHQNKKNKL